LWDRLRVIAQVELQLSNEEWLEIDYRLFHLLHDRWLTLRWQDQWQQGALIAAIHNNGFRSYKTPIEAADFVFTIAPGHKRSARKVVKRKRLTKEKQLQIADLFRSLAIRKPCPVTSPSA
jgi:hypothetical protein